MTDPKVTEAIARPMRGESGLVQRVVEGVPLIFGATMLARAVAFLSTIVLARILEPDDFGLISMALIAFLLSIVVLDTALPQAFIQSKRDLDVGASTALVLVSVGGIGIYGAIALLAPLIASFFSQPLLAGLIPLLAVGYALHGLGRIPIAVLERRMDYRRRALPEILGPLTLAVVSVALAAGSQGSLGVWALAWGHVAQWAAWALAGWLLAGWRPTHSFNRDVAREQVAFARDVAGVGLLLLLVRNVDTIVVGRFLGAEAVGLYSMAFNVSQLPGALLSASLIRVFFPVFSRLQDQPEELRRMHRHAVKIAAALACPLAAMTIIVAPDFVSVAFGAKWVGADVPMQLLAIYGLAWVLTGINGSLLTATDRRRQMYGPVIVMLVVLAPVLATALSFGIVAVAAVFSGAMVVGAVASQVLLARALGSTFWRQGLPLAGPAVAASVSAVGMSWMFHASFGPLGLPAQVAMLGATGLVYLALLLLIDRDVLLAVRAARSWRARAGVGPANSPVGV